MAKNDGKKIKVFLCHARTDQAAARVLYGRLSADGYGVWLDEESVLPGQKKKDVISKAEQNSDIIVICLSNSSIKEEGYFQREYNHALDISKEKPPGTIFIIPARFNDCEVPNDLGELHWVDLFEDGGYERLKRALEFKSNQEQNTNEQVEAGIDLAQDNNNTNAQMQPSVFAKQEHQVSPDIQPVPKPKQRQALLYIALGLLSAIIFLFLLAFPSKLVVNISNELSHGVVKEFSPIEMKNASIWSEALPVKGDSPVTVEVRTLNVFGGKIPPNTLNYHWELCCNDQQNNTSDNGHLQTWKFEPPTYLPNETLTITVSNIIGSVEAMIPFTITTR